MKTLCIVLLFLTVCCGTAAAQTPDDAAVLRTIARGIIDSTTFSVVNRSTGKLFTESTGLPVAKEYRVDSRYNTWNYWNGVLTIALLKLGAAFSEPKYGEFAQKNIRFLFTHMPYFAKQYAAGLCETDMMHLYRLEMLDDCGAMGAGVMDVYVVDKDERYRAYVNKAAAYIRDKEHRLDDRTFVRTGPASMTLWADDLFMSVPFMARYARLSGETGFYDDAISQVVNFNRYLSDTRTGLYYHCWYSDIKENGVAHWGRANGWVMMAEIELLNILPSDHPRRQEVLDILKRHIIAVARFQSQSGLWHQLLDKQDSYLETSCTAMFTYSIARAVNNNWIDKRFSSVALRGWEGIRTRVRSDGQVEGICEGTGVANDLSFYYTRPTPLNDIHGLGAVLLAGIEVIGLKKNSAAAH